MHRRVNITLPEETIRLIDRAVARGDRSRFIDRAVRHFVQAARRTRLRRLLKEGAVRRGERDLLLAEEWFGLRGPGPDRLVLAMHLSQKGETLGDSPAPSVGGPPLPQSGRYAS